MSSGIKNEWRVFVSGNSGDGLWFTVEDVETRGGKMQILHHRFGDGDGKLVAQSIPDLRRTLEAMLEALDKPILRETQLIEPVAEAWQQMVRR